MVTRPAVPTPNGAPFVFIAPADLCCCSRSRNRATINEVACKTEGFIIRQSPCPGPVETIPASFAPNFQPVQEADCREPFAVLSLRPFGAGLSVARSAYARGAQLPNA